MDGQEEGRAKTVAVAAIAAEIRPQAGGEEAGSLFETWAHSQIVAIANRLGIPVEDITGPETNYSSSRAAALDRRGEATFGPGGPALEMGSCGQGRDR